MNGRPLRGLNAWIVQRLGALYLLAFLGWAVVALGLEAPADVHAWRAWLARPGNGVAVALFWLALLAHAWVGLRDVILDYVHPLALRALALALAAGGLLAAGLWAARILWGLAA